ncbi:hypothetical protein PsYK624_129120 [Phanerochaete sordida]|uniref:Uncharacterized protein n=1 Tax=Phanerochaete sordida TaxID=48140 RepID=A0A9P3GK63_9APHY|nr:hypothetical protein PsYK624_129120 [Phanerochaete sordida]
MAQRSPADRHRGRESGAAAAHVLPELPGRDFRVRASLDDIWTGFLCDAAPSTLLAAVGLGRGTGMRVYYLSEHHQLREYRYSHSQLEWSAGELNDLNPTALQGEEGRAIHVYFQGISAPAFTED